MTRTPDKIITDFEAAVTGTADIAPYEILHEAFDSLRQVYRENMVLLGVEETAIEDIELTVEDFLVNFYGDDGRLDDFITQEPRVDSLRIWFHPSDTNIVVVDGMGNVNPNDRVMVETLNLDADSQDARWLLGGDPVTKAKYVELLNARLDANRKA